MTHYFAAIELLQPLDHTEFEEQFSHDGLSRDLIGQMLDEVDSRLLRSLARYLATPGIVRCAAV